MLVPRAAAEMIAAAGVRGDLTMRLSTPDRACRILALSNEDGATVRLPEDPHHFLSSADWNTSGHWYHSSSTANAAWYISQLQGRPLTFKGFKEIVPKAMQPGVGDWHIALTYCENPDALEGELRLPKLVGWRVTHDTVEPMQIDVEPEIDGLLALSPHWPVEVVRAGKVLLIGAGSIGGATAMGLAAYGLGRLDLVDPDRLLFHNVVRHVCETRSIGRYKVDAIIDAAKRKWPETQMNPFRLDAIEKADVLRPLIAEADLVVCTVDGVEARRVVSYLCKTASTELILSCVLEDGRYGEMIRIRPFAEVGCLECQRRHLQEAGRMDMDSRLDRGYGTGTRHNPMTAVGGDLHLIGATTAKAAIASLLARAGIPDQRIENDNAILALRPEPGLSAPFDATRAMGITWYPATPPYEDCRACKKT